MSTTTRARHYTDPVTGLTNIRWHPEAHEYQSVDEVKRMVTGRASVGTCPLCHQPLPAGTDGEDKPDDDL
jgi:hypothetical protein